MSDYHGDNPSVTILDLKTGRVVTPDTSTAVRSTYSWSIGDEGCDCNRALEFAANQDERFDLIGSGKCGAERFVIVATDSQYMSVEQMNEYYAPEIIELALRTYQDLRV